MCISKHRGNKIICINNKWFYADTGILVSENPNVKCGHCGKEQTKEGHDGCLGRLEGVMNACCGHGVESEAYVQFSPAYIISGKEARVFIDSLE